MNSFNSTYQHQKNFLRSYGKLIRYSNDDLLYWYFSYNKEPTTERVNAEIKRRMEASNPGTWCREKRRNYQKQGRKRLHQLLQSIGERADILYEDQLRGIPHHESLAIVSLPVPTIRRLHAANPGQPYSKIWVEVGELLGC